MRASIHLRWCLAVALAVTPAAMAADDDVCASDADYLSGSAYLRAVSLDVRGVVPTLEEYELMGDSDDIPEEILDAWLVSDQFADRVARHHNSLLWNNVQGTRLFGTRFRLSSSRGIYWRRRVAVNYRGADVPCSNREATFDEWGRPEPLVNGGVRDEGYVWVNPYWAPETQVRVCAYDAQDTMVSPRGTPCDTNDGLRDPDCGCGPSMAWCALGNIEGQINEAFGEDVDRRVRRMIVEDEPYTELLTGHKGYVNGPMTHFLRYANKVPAGVRMDHTPYGEDVLPDLDFADRDTWVEVNLGPEQAGIFTSPAYLLRFQTGRARANRFYGAFMCQPFQAPPGGIPADVGVPTIDLTARPGCNYCHAILEPASAHWGRWTPAGAGYLDPEDFPAYDAGCAWCGEEGVACDDECRRYYITRPINSEEVPFMGWMASYAFLDERHHHHVEQGPKLLVKAGMVDGRLTECVANNAASSLLGRQLAENDDGWLEGLTQGFKDSDFRYRDLVRDIVTSPNYRRLP